MADFLYKGVVDWFLDQMSQEAMVPGDKMPSLRALSKELGLSLNTVIHGYELLTEDGWIESRPKSGYFICHRSDAKPALLSAGEEARVLENEGTKPAWSCLAHRGALVDQSDTFLSPITRQDEIALPVLGKGHLAVRESVRDYLKGLGIKTHAANIWLGRSPLAMFTQSVLTLSNQDDAVLVLLPCDPRLTTTLQSLGRRVVTLGAGDHGVDFDLIVSCLQDEDIRLIVLPGQFSFPTGQLISNLTLRRWLAIIDKIALPVIEWDLCSHLAYRASPLLTYKSLDQSDNIVYIGGIESKGVDSSAGWCLSGRFQSQLEGAFLGGDMALTDAQQTALSDALEPNGKYPLSRRARDVWANSERVKAILEMRLGDKISFAESKGGLCLWVNLAQPLAGDSITLLLASFRHAIVPGTLLSREPDAAYWLAVNVTLDNVEALATSLSDHLSRVTEAAKEPEPEPEAEKELPVIDEPEDAIVEDDAEPVSESEESLIESIEDDETDDVVDELIEEPVEESIEELQQEEALPEELLPEPEELVSEESTVSEEAVEPEESAPEETIEEDPVSSEIKEEESVSEREEKKESKSRDATSEPLYNPMLDLINHDFG